MPRSTDLTGKIRTVGLAASFVAVAAIGLTLVGDRGLSGAVCSGAQPERIFLLAIAVVLCIANAALLIAHRAKATHHQIEIKGLKPDAEGSCRRR